MTREEAIHELQEDKRLYETEVCHAGDGSPDGRLLEALDMAIEALQANDGLRCALAGGRKCFAQGYEFTWCITCPHISEEDRQLVNHAVLAIPSAEAVPTVIRAKTFMRKEDFDKWAEDIKKQGENIICIPCDAEIVSADDFVESEVEE